MRLILLAFLACCLVGCQDKNIDIGNYISDEVIQNDIWLKVYSNQSAFDKNEDVKLYFEFEYVGDEEEITIYHSELLTLSTIIDSEGNKTIEEGTDLNPLKTILIKNEIYRYLFVPYNKVRVYDHTELNETSTFKLKKGEYAFTPALVFRYNEHDRKNITITATINFSVE